MSASAGHAVRRAAALLLAAAACATAGGGAPRDGFGPAESAAPHPTLPDAPAVAPTTPLTRIAFGSCNREDLPQPLWPRIAAGAPQLWVWTGDNVYGDTDDMSVLAAKYARQQRQPDYRAFALRVPIVGVWDDHDYGVNDGGREYRRRAESQQLALDFLGEPATGPRRRRAGMHAAYSYGPPGRRVKVILLDTRYFRDPLPARGATSDGDILGETQWRWLERELRTGAAQVHVLVSSIQVIPADHPYEKWANFPRARRRLLALIGASGAQGVVLVSGDRHVAELSRLTSPTLAYPLYELTSSGLTHTWRGDGSGAPPTELNRHRVGPLVAALNYGTLDIVWDRPAPRVTLRVRDARGAVRIEQVVDVEAARRRR